jgi:hypothetical protein
MPIISKGNSLRSIAEGRFRDFRECCFSIAVLRSQPNKYFAREPKEPIAVPEFRRRCDSATVRLNPQAVCAPRARSKTIAFGSARSAWLALCYDPSISITTPTTTMRNAVRRAFFMTPDEIDELVRQRQAKASRLQGRRRKQVLREIEELRQLADAKRWAASTGLRPGNED